MLDNATMTSDQAYRVAVLLRNAIRSIHCVSLERDRRRDDEPENANHEDEPDPQDPEHRACR